MSICGGMIYVEDGVKKTEEYAPARKVHVELAFDVDPGQDADELIYQVAERANAKVSELLGCSTPARAVTVHTKVTDEPTEAQVFEAQKEALGKLTRPGLVEIKKQVLDKLKPAPHIVTPADVIASVMGDDVFTSVIGDAKARKAKKADVDPITGASPTSAPANAGPVVHGASASSAPASEKIISRDDLYKATSSANEVTRNPIEITRLVKKHSASQPEGKQSMNNIPVENRQAYIDDLDILKAAFGPAV